RLEVVRVLVRPAVIDIVFDGDLAGGGAVVAGRGRIPTGRRVAGRPARTSGHADVLRAGNAGRSGIANCHGESAGAAVACGIGGLVGRGSGSESEDIAAMDLGLVGLAVDRKGVVDGGGGGGAGGGGRGGV